jgi:mRNA-degrading endonuclease RelE of RelBE toxin-antitoxin system
VTRIVWTDRGKADVRAIDRSTALRILQAITRYAREGIGDVKALENESDELRLRVGDWRVFFAFQGGAIHIERVRHRSQAYRS